MAPEEPVLVAGKLPPVVKPSGFDLKSRIFGAFSMKKNLTFWRICRDIL